uniref:Tetratricopeptide SHNi-TPR domain-containing protein n=1 Tax=Trichuris muris TaxID=70415 RepID=A0A5S6QYF7_TRIMR
MAEQNVVDQSETEEQNLTASQLLVEGKRRMFMEEYVAAADFFSKSLEKAVAEYGDSDLRLVTHFCLYANALIAAGNSFIDDETEESDLSDAEPEVNVETVRRDDKTEDNVSKSDDDEEIEMSNSDIAIECLISARKILEEQEELPDKSKKKLGSICLQLADIAAKSMKWSQTCSDADKALDVFCKIEGVPLTTIAECYYFKGMAAEMQGDSDEAKRSYDQANELLKRCAEQIKEHESQPANSDDEEEFKSLVESYEDMMTKMEVRKYMLDNSVEQKLRDGVQKMIESSLDFSSLPYLGVKRKVLNEDVFAKRSR